MPIRRTHNSPRVRLPRPERNYRAATPKSTLREAHVTRHAPKGAEEIALLDEVAQTQWRVIRLRRTETAFLTQLIDQIREEQPELDEDEAMAQAFLQKEHAPKMRLYLRYQTAIERAHSKAVTELEKVLKQRRPPPPPPADRPRR